MAEDFDEALKVNTSCDVMVYRRFYAIMYVVQLPYAASFTCSN